MNILNRKIGEIFVSLGKQNHLFSHLSSYNFQKLRLFHWKNHILLHNHLDTLAQYASSYLTSHIPHTSLTSHIPHTSLTSHIPHTLRINDPEVNLLKVIFITVKVLYKV